MRGIAKILTVGLCFAAAVQAELGTLVDDSYIALPANQNVTFYAGQNYTLTEEVYVDSGCTLVIQPDVWVSGVAALTPSSPTSVLVVARGGYLHAVGTVDSPIVFTASTDKRSDPYDLGPGMKGLWGGVIVMGSAQINNPFPSGHAYEGMHNIEGLSTGDPRNYYGCTAWNAANQAQCNAVMKYVSIRHGGYIAGSNDEINGLTFGGCGENTTAEYVEVFANSDDGFEMFGGANKLRYCVAAFVGDDGVDYDEGFTGLGQFLFVIGDPIESDKGGEHDGGDNASYLNRPKSNPKFMNCTYIGGGHNSVKSYYGLFFEDSAGGHYRNSIFAGYTTAGVRSSGPGTKTPRPWGPSANGYRSLRGCTFWDIGANDRASIAYSASDTMYLLADSNRNFIKNPHFISLSREMQKPFLDPRLCDTSSTLTDTCFSTLGAWFYPSQFRGAFGRAAFIDNLWIDGWTALSEKDIAVRRLYTRPHSEWTRGTVTMFTFRTNDLFRTTNDSAWYSIDRGATWVDTTSLLSSLVHNYSDCGYRVGMSNYFWTNIFPENPKDNTIWFRFKREGTVLGTPDTLLDTVKIIVH